MMYGNKVTLYGYSVQGSDRVELGKKDSILFVNAVEIDGEYLMSEGQVRLSLDGSEGFLILELLEPTLEEREHWADQLREFDQAPDRELVGPTVLRDGKAVPFWGTLTPEDYSLGSTAEHIALPVRTVEFIEVDAYPLQITEIRHALLSQVVS